MNHRNYLKIELIDLVLNDRKRHANKTETLLGLGMPRQPGMPALWNKNKIVKLHVRRTATPQLLSSVHSQFSQTTKSLRTMFFP